MPNIKSAVKRVRTAEAKRQQNKSIKSSLRTAVKAAKTDNVETPVLSSAFSALDKAAAKGVIHKNKAARVKSRLARKTEA